MKDQTEYFFRKEIMEMSPKELEHSQRAWREELVIDINTLRIRKNPIRDKAIHCYLGGTLSTHRLIEILKDTHLHKEDLVSWTKFIDKVMKDLKRYK